VILIKFGLHRLEKENWENIKRLTILITLLLAAREARIGLRGIQNPKLKTVIEYLRWGAAGFSILIAYGFVLDNKKVLHAVEIINDIWGIVATLLTALLIYVIGKNNSSAN
jgi:hypothetical protein